MRKSVTDTLLGKVAVLILLLVGLPLLGVYFKGESVAAYLDFPPKTEMITGLPQSTLVYWLGVALLILLLVPFIWVFLKKGIEAGNKRTHSYRTVRHTYYFPWWGWAGVAGIALFWFLSWYQFEGWEHVQRHVFTPLWLSFIVTVNAITYWRKGNCVLKQHTAYFLWLFPVSALFWWYFEFLNQFVNNWHYINITRGSDVLYFLEATFPFMTVIPAVVSVKELLASSDKFDRGFRNFRTIQWIDERSVWLAAGLIGGLSLMFIGYFPRYLFPFIWFAPLLIWIAIRQVTGDATYWVKHAARGDWRPLWGFAIAALICGFFWEMWNYNSYSRWIYNVPFVEKGHLFEMPLPGYAGYLPFGLECAVISEAVWEWIRQK